MSILDVSLQMMALVYEQLAALPGATPTTVATDQMLSGLGGSTRLHTAITDAEHITALSHDDVVRLGRIATQCIGSVAPGTGIAHAVAVVGIIVGIVNAIVQVGQGLPDNLAGDTVNEIDVSTVAATTRVITLTPVTNPGPSGGTPAPGWKVVDSSTSLVDCGYPSPAAVSNGIHTCSPTAASANVCWPAPEDFVYCLRDPWKKSLVAIPASNTSTPVTATRNPVPLGIALADGTHCLLRDGGSDPGRAADPDLVIGYYCGSSSVWSKPDQPIDRHTAAWTVRVGGATGPLRTEAVTEAYFAGN